MKKLVTIVLVLLSLSVYAQTEDQFYRQIDWEFYADAVVVVDDSTYNLEALPTNLNDPGALMREIGNYVVDYVGNRFKVISSTATTLTVVDEYHIGIGPQSGQLAKCYQSVRNGTYMYVGSVDYSRLNSATRWRLNGSDNELLARAIDLRGFLTSDTLIIRNDSLLLGNNVGIPIDSLTGSLNENYVQISDSASLPGYVTNKALIDSLLNYTSKSYVDSVTADLSKNFYTFTLESGSSVQNRITATTPNWPATWSLAASGVNFQDLEITHNMGRTTFNVTVWRFNTATDTQIKQGNSAWSALHDYDGNMLKIQSLCTDPVKIQIKIAFD